MHKVCSKATVVYRFICRLNPLAEIITTVHAVLKLVTQQQLTTRKGTLDSRIMRCVENTFYLLLILAYNQRIREILCLK